MLDGVEAILEHFWIQDQLSTIQRPFSQNLGGLLQPFGDYWLIGGACRVSQ
jgi:hypothetical protein